MNRYKVTHNGYTTEYFNNAAQVEEYIANTIAEHEDLSPIEIYRGYAADNKATNELLCGGELKSVVIFQYRTLYTEVFMIVEDNF